MSIKTFVIMFAVQAGLLTAIVAPLCHEYLKAAASRDAAAERVQEIKDQLNK
uniref:hypothetical protein n=1 Tax=Petrachloros mirabilis TaxID=2918835 RepID=UPI001379D929|nr:hypothetical protein [Petrachloros mirabilis]